jgi:type I restriction-modification system DNA methylase subunit
MTPCCGSGGIFVQSEKFIEAHEGRLENISVSGQYEDIPGFCKAAALEEIKKHDFIPTPGCYAGFEETKIMIKNLKRKRKG